MAKIELQFLIFFVLILGLRLQRYSANTKRYPPKKLFGNFEFCSSRQNYCRPNSLENCGTEVESRTQGSRPRTQKNPRPRLRTAFPRTEPLEAKDRNARGQDQGHRRKRSPKKKRKVFKNIFQAISNSLAYPKFLIKEGLNHKSHDMTSAKFFQRGSFCGTEIS